MYGVTKTPLIYTTVQKFKGQQDLFLLLLFQKEIDRDGKFLMYVTNKKMLFFWTFYWSKMPKNIK